MWDFQVTKIMVNQNWGAIGVSSDTPENLEGFHADNLLFIVDEAKGVSKVIFDAIMGTMTTNTWLWINSTPSPNPLGEFVNAFKPGSIYKTMHVSCLDSPQVRQEYIDNMKKKYGERSAIYQMKVLGEFPTEAEDTLIPWQHVDAATKRIITIDYSKEYERRISVDVARFGMDKTVIKVIDIQNGEHKVIHLHSFAKEPTTFTVGEILRIDREFHANTIRVDAGGGDLGAGVVDQLMTTEVDYKVEAFVAGGTHGFDDTDKQFYTNWKAKAYDHLRVLFEQGRISIPDDEELTEQLILLRKDYGMNGKLKILDYDEELKGSDIKHKSPDFADALNIGCAPLRVEDYHVLDSKGVL